MNLLATTPNFTTPNFTTSIFAVLACIVVLILGYIGVHYYNCKRAWQLAPALHTWLLENFALLDSNGDGLITSDDIERHWHTAKAAERYQKAEHGRALNNDRKMAAHARYFLCDIGHVVKTIYVGSPMTGCMTGIKVYAINLADVEAFPERALLRYQREFPRG